MSDAPVPAPLDAIAALPVDAGPGALARGASRVLDRVVPGLSHALFVRRPPATTWRLLATAGPHADLTTSLVIAARQAASRGFAVPGHDDAWCVPFAAGDDVEGRLVLIADRGRSLPPAGLRLLQELAALIGRRLHEAQTFAQAARERRWLEVLQSTPALLHAATSPAEAGNGAGSALDHALPGCTWWLVRRDENGAIRPVVTSALEQLPREAATAARRALDAGGVVVEGPPSAAVLPASAPLVAAARVRDRRGRGLAALVVRTTLDTALDADDGRAPLAALADLLGTSLELIALSRTVRVLRGEDPDSGCISPAMLQETVAAAVDAAHGEARAAALILVQNDPLDAPTDARVANALGALITGAVEEMEADVLVARIRPWQYAVLGQGLSGRDAVALAARLRWLVRNGGLADRPATASVGIALIPTHGTSYDDVYAAAVTALDEARRSRDTEVIAPRRTSLAPRPQVPAGMNAMERLAILRQLARLIDEWHFRGVAHSEAVAQRARDLAIQLGAAPAEIELVTLAGELHDIGRALLPERLFASRELTPDEHRLVRTHVVLGGRLIAAMGLDDVGNVVAHLHERVDGTGVPHALAGTAIPFGSRILAVANAFETVLDSLGRGDGGRHDAIRAVRASRGTSFDPDVVDCLLALVARDRAGAA